MACALARDHAGRVIVLHVATPPPFVRSGELHRALEEPEGYRRDLEQRLRREYDDAAVLPGHVLKEGLVVQQILDAANETGAELIVMGTHGRTGMTRLLLGSVAEAVLRQAHCAVLTIKLSSEAPAQGEAAPLAGSTK